MTPLKGWYTMFEVDRAVLSRYDATVPLLVPNPLVHELRKPLCNQLFFQRCDLYCLFSALRVFQQNVPENTIVQRVKKKSANHSKIGINRIWILGSFQKRFHSMRTRDYDCARNRKHIVKEV